MKYEQRLLAILLFYIIIENMGIMAFAMNTGFTTENISNEKMITFVDNINIKLLEEEPRGMSIECYDINKNGMFAIGTERFEQKKIAVYNIEGIFQYGISFDSSGTFYLELTDDDKLIIYFVRSDMAVSVNSVGEVEEVLNIPDTLDNNRYWRYIQAPKKKVGETQYKLKNDMGILNIFATSYSQIVAIDAEGNETVIFDADTTAEQVTIIIIVFIGITIFIVAFTIYIVRLIKQNKNSNTR